MGFHKRDGNVRTEAIIARASRVRPGSALQPRAQRNAERVTRDCDDLCEHDLRRHTAPIMDKQHALKILNSLANGVHPATAELFAADSPSELREGLYPRPPSFVEPAQRDPRTMFWTIKHGIKMSAKPAWGKSHDDEAIWNMVAFVRKVPTIGIDQRTGVRRV
jgi:hypothetical protein